MFGAIEGDVDATHRIMHTALSGYGDDATWDLACLPAYVKKSAAQEPRSELAKEFAMWECKDKDNVDPSTCIYWIDERELRFAKVRVCLRAFGLRCTDVLLSGLLLHVLISMYGVSRTLWIAGTTVVYDILT